MFLRIITPRHEVLKTETDYVSLPGELGRMGIMKGHSQLISALASGKIIYHKEGRNESVDIKDGCVEVAQDKITALIDC